eukprot:m.58822 g.58822  ORF g.58822 m.58822 type:complete len:192 (+) comp12206_c1_seq2:231-806(+)
MVVVQSQAAVRMVVHAARWPFNGVFGILLGKRQDGNTLLVEDAVPVFHVHKNLAPMLEIALLQTEKFAKDQGLEIVGCYAANENADDNKPDEATKKIASKIQETLGEATILMIENTRLGSPLSAFKPFSSHGEDWRHSGEVECASPDEAERALATLLPVVGTLAAADFDEHLENPTRAWLSCTAVQAALLK